jgi:hypothetical protein
MSCPITVPAMQHTCLQIYSKLSARPPSQTSDHLLYLYTSQIRRFHCKPSSLRTSGEGRPLRDLSQQLWQPFKTHRASQRNYSSEQRPNFTYRIAASYCAKKHKLEIDKNQFNFNPYSRFQPPSLDRPNSRRPKSRRPASGQDAFFVSRVGDTGDVAFGVVHASLEMTWTNF